MTQLELFQTYFGFRLCHLVFAITEEVSLFLHSKNIMLQDAVGQVNVARRCLERHRTDEAYNLFYEKLPKRFKPINKSTMSASC